MNFVLWHVSGFAQNSLRKEQHRKSYRKPKCQPNLQRKLHMKIIWHLDFLLQVHLDYIHVYHTIEKKFETFQTISASKNSKNYSKKSLDYSTEGIKLFQKENNFPNGIRLFQKAWNYSRRHKTIPEGIKLFHTAWNYSKRHKIIPKGIKSFHFD